MATWQSDRAHFPDTAEDKMCNPYFVRLFLVAFALLIVTYPFLERMSDGILIYSILFTAVILSALPAICASRTTMVWGVSLALPAVTFKWANYWSADPVTAKIFLVTGLLFCGFIIAHFLIHIMRATRVDINVLCIAVANYFLIGLAWSFIYQLVSQSFPGAFIFTAGAPRNGIMGFEGFYFSMATLSTVGYGDVIPALNISKMAAMIESVTGVFYTTIFVARLVAIFSSEQVEKVSTRQAGTREKEV